MLRVQLVLTNYDSQLFVDFTESANFLQLVQHILKML